ncbi:UNVERIFIED_CONTAM: hypothetical protein RMT77_006135 [Armadillidium vulgare]
MKLIQNTLTCKVFNCIPARVVLGILCSAGVMELYSTRTNFSIAIVAMVRIVSSSGSGNVSDIEVKIPYCLRIQNNTEKNDSAEEKTKELPPIAMTTTQRGNVLSAFFYAYGFSGIIGGRFAELYGTKKVFGLGVMVDAIGNFLIPITAKTHYGLLFFLRFTIGFFQGACYPSLHPLTSKWIPPKEISRFVGFVYVCNSFGTIFSLTACGAIISDLGWEAVFYISGALSLAWVTVWTLLMHDTPAEHPRILDEEKRYIESSMAADKNMKRKVPWLKMLLSIPLWSIHIAHMGNMLGLSFMLTQLPIYMGSILGTDIKNNGLLSAIPFVARVIGSNLFSWMETFVQNKYKIRKKTNKVILTIIGFGGTGVSIVLVGYVGCNSAAAISLMVLGMFCNGATNTGYMSNHLDIAPNFAGTAFGMSSLVGFSYGMIGPVVVGAITKEEVIQEWTRVYWFVFASYVITGGIFIIFSSTEVQPWNDGSPIEKNKVVPKTAIKTVAPYEDGSDKYKINLKSSDKRNRAYSGY